MPRARAESFDVHPAVAHAQRVIENIPENTGRTVATWSRLIARAKLPADPKARRAWLKAEHGLGVTTAGMLADLSLGHGADWTDGATYLRHARGYVEAMYSGAKAGLRPIHDALVELARSLGKEIRICPCQTIVPVYREHVIAQIQPSTRTRIDFGLALKGAKGRLPARLLATGGLEKGDRITHRIPIASVDEIDATVRKWLRVSYDLDA